EAFAPIVTAVLIVWPAAQVVLGFIAGLGTPITSLLIAIHALVIIIAIFGVLLMTAPAAFDVLKGYLQKAGVNLSASSYNPPGMGGGGAAAGGGGTVEQRLAELDAAWGRGGMTPEEYQQRRAQIMSGR